jgi:glycerophosphoryl diester phosphodiesterase
MAKHAQIWAAGGESCCAPEDTLVAYWGALGAGADGLAITLQLTADGIPVCFGGATLAQSCGDPRGVAAVTWKDLRRLDAGTMFRSTEIDERNQPKGTGDDTPWEGVKSKQKPLYHPRLSEALLLFGRRTGLLLMFPPTNDRLKALVQATCKEVDRFGLADHCVLAGDEAALKLVKTHLPASTLAYVAPANAGAAEIAKTAKRIGADKVIVDAQRLVTRKGALAAGVAGAFGKTAHVLVASSLAPTPECHAGLRRQPWLAGFIGRAVDRIVAMECKPHLVVAERFAGTTPDLDLWTMGYSRISQDTTIRQDDGVVIEIKSGGQYSGAAVVTNFPIRGDFDARIQFEVASPHQGTTFELACVHIDPGFHHIDNTKLDNRAVHLTFDVHGAPPYASSERDEDDGFRIGWNNGPAVTEFVQHSAQSSNIYNKYSRDVGDATASNPKGQLRLVRRGAVFNSYYTDRHNRGWVLSGTALVPTLCQDVFLRLGGKHWPKQGKTPPPNRIKFTDFRLFQ